MSLGGQLPRSHPSPCTCMPARRSRRAPFQRSHGSPPTWNMAIVQRLPDVVATCRFIVERKTTRECGDSSPLSFCRGATFLRERRIAKCLCARKEKKRSLRSPSKAAINRRTPKRPLIAHGRLVSCARYALARVAGTSWPESWQWDNVIGASARPSEYLGACHPSAFILHPSAFILPTLD